MLTTLGCPGTPHPRNSSADRFWGIPELRLTIPVGSAREALDRGGPQLRNFSTEEFLGSGVPGHPSVVSIQGWFLRGQNFFFPYNPLLPPSRQTPPPGQPTPESLISVHFGSVSVLFGSVWVRFGSISGPFRVHFGVLDGVGERGFCKEKEYHWPRRWTKCRYDGSLFLSIRSRNSR